MNIVYPDSVWRSWLHAENPEPANRHQRAVNLRLDQVLETAPTVKFDNRSRFVFFSDCHRGDGSRADAFARNEKIFLHALEDYDRNGFSYVEVGDGDELWQNRHLKSIRRAHPTVFDRLHTLDRDGRLHLLLGNHDINRRFQNVLEKDGLQAKEGIILQHTQTRQRILVTHGHQADITSDRRPWLGRFVVRHIWRKVLLAGLIKGAQQQPYADHQPEWEQVLFDNLQRAKFAIERRLIAWVRTGHHMLICGHTHRPVIARFGTTPYFNTGSCIIPGYITGLEIENGAIAQVRWHIDEGRIKRTMMARPQKLSTFPQT